MPFAGFKDFDECVGRISSRTNPKTKKPYSSESAHKICGSLQAKHEKKSTEYKSQFLPLPLESKDSGFKATLTSSALDLGDDMVSDACIDDVIHQVASSVAKFKGSYLHDAVIERNPNLPPLSKMDTATRVPGKLMEMIGTWNEAHPEWMKIKPMIDNGMLDGISIEYVPEKFSRMEKDGKTIRVLEKIRLLGYGHVPRPMNMDSAIKEVFQKSFDQFKEPEPTDEELVLLDGSNPDVGPTKEMESVKMDTISVPANTATAVVSVDTKNMDSCMTAKMKDGMSESEAKSSCEKMMESKKDSDSPSPESKADAPQADAEVKQLKAQLETAQKELEEVKARLSDSARIEEIKSIVMAQVKELQPNNKILIPSENETKVAENLTKAEFSDYIAARAAMGG